MGWPSQPRQVLLSPLHTPQASKFSIEPHTLLQLGHSDEEKAMHAFRGEQMPQPLVKAHSWRETKEQLTWLRC
jgi:hypothetical protein